MAGSAADAISKAVERSQQLLFPFNANKWFALGFTVFLAQCGEGGASIPNIPTGSGSGSGTSGSTGFDFSKTLSDAWAWFGSDLALYVTLGALSLALVIGLWVVVLWFSSRARLMLVESVIWDRVELGAQWSRAAELGMSLCKFRVVFGVSAACVILGGFAGGAAVALPAWQAGDFFGSRALTGYAIMGATSFFLWLPVVLTSAILDDFVVPLMVVRNVRVGAAWTMCKNEVLAGNVGGVIVFYLLRIGLAFAIAMAVSIITCLTCCMTALPYVGTVALLPIFVFSRAYPLYYLEQLGIQVFPRPEPQWAAYDEWRFPR